MDTRTALPSGTDLRFTNSEGGCVRYTIIGELGRGGSSIVYDASYRTNMGDERTVRIKECYPFGMSVLRSRDGGLYPEDGVRAAFETEKERFRGAFLRNNVLFALDGLTNSVANTIDLYERNGTCYVVSTYLGGETLATYRFGNLKDAVRVIAGTARAVSRLHDAGYLYLDLKPENVFVIFGTTELIQLFDFDSVIRMDEAADTSRQRISYTKGFAALELQLGRRARIGRHTDVFGIGALLFYVLFGRAPSAFDRENGAGYDYSAYGTRYSDRLYEAITDFLHRTLDSFVPARFQTMTPLLEALEQLERLADECLPRLLSSVTEPPFCFGRARERAELAELLDGPARAVNLYGMGGIGKTTLAARTVLDLRRSYDSVLFADWLGSVKRLLTDDVCVRINTVERLREETAEEYLARKTRALKALTQESRVLLVLDNVSPEDVNELRPLADIGWQLLLISRERLPVKAWPGISIGALDTQALTELFEAALGRVIREDERAGAAELLHMVNGHTLAVELIGRQLRASLLTMEQAVAMIGSVGFTGMNGGPICYERDHLVYTGQMSALLERLFAPDMISEAEIVLLRCLSLFGISGASVGDLRALCEPRVLDGAARLIRLGWLTEARGRLRMHPVTYEYVFGREWTGEQHAAVRRMLDMLYRRLHRDGDGPDADRRYPALLRYLDIAERFVEGYTRPCAERTRLMYHLAIDAPLDREENTPRYAEQLLARPQELEDGCAERLLSELALICGRMGEDARADAALSALRKRLAVHPSAYYTSVYLHTGAVILYNRGPRYERACLARFQAAAVAARMSRNPKAKRQLILCLTSRALTLLASPFLSARGTDRLLSEAEGLMDRYTKPHDYERYQYLCVRALYHAVSTGEKDAALAAMDEATRIADTARDSELSWLEHLVQEAAPLYRELWMWNEAELALCEALKGCERHKGIAPYDRLTDDICDMLFTLQLARQEEYTQES